jgi:flagellar basal body-associated protein FliL
MADATPAQGIVAEDAAAKPKRGLGRILLPVLCLLIGAGAGVAGAIFAPRLFPAAAPAAEGGEAAPPKAVPRVAPLEYVEIDNTFTSNLKDTGRFVQLRIAVSTHGGKPVLDAVQRHRLAVISVVLQVLADTTEAELSQPGGRDALTRRMRMAINDLLQRKSGIAGIDDVYLTSFVVQ